MTAGPQIQTLEVLVSQFLSHYTLEEIGKSLHWVRSYAYYLHKRFPLPEAEDRLRATKEWQWYLNVLVTDKEVSPEDRACGPKKSGDL